MFSTRLHNFINLTYFNFVTVAVDIRVLFVVVVSTCDFDIKVTLEQSVTTATSESDH